MKLYDKTAFELSKMLEAKEISAEELLDSVFERIGETEDMVGAYITQTRELALKQAKAVDAKRANGKGSLPDGKLSPLAGIPLAVKDNISVKNVKMTCASKMLENYAPPFSSSVIERLIENGVVITGKTNLDEFAIGSTGEKSYFKETRNPHDLNRVSGGSSSGSAAALAAGGAILALGSDTGGSARLPAAYCGVVGLRPTYGAVSRHGLAAYASSMDTICPMARSVKDATMLLSAICGFDKADATTLKREYPDFAAELEADIKGKVIGIPAEYLDAVTDKEIKNSILAAVKKLENAGAVIKEISLPSTKYALAAYYAISSAEASSNLAKYDGVRFGHRAGQYADVNELIEKSRTEGFGLEVQRRILLGTNILSSQYFDSYYKPAALMRERIKAELEAALEGCDCLIAPVSPVAAPEVRVSKNEPISGTKTATCTEQGANCVQLQAGGESAKNAEMYETDICNIGAGLAHLPAISLPCAEASDGMPIGMQIIGKRFGELAMLQAAYYYEQNIYAAKLPEPDLKGGSRK